jgi:hypothetical protein
VSDGNDGSTLISEHLHAFKLSPDGLWVAIRVQKDIAFTRVNTGLVRNF